MTIPGKLHQIWRYPVKSMGGERVPSVDVLQHGLVGDRVWCARDEVLDEIAFCKRRRGLLDMQATVVNEREPTAEDGVSITYDGRTVSVGSAEATAMASRAAGSPMTLWQLQPADRLEFYTRRRAARDNLRAEMAELFGLEDGGRLPDLSSFPEHLQVFATPPGTYFDAYPVHILSLQSLNWAERRLPGMGNVLRFRPNLVLDLPCLDGDQPEAGFIGNRISVGSVELEIVSECPRCVVPTHAQPGAARDVRIGRVLREEMNFSFGVYARVQNVGTICEGDQIRQL
jgi:uncharacterized protein